MTVVALIIQVLSLGFLGELIGLLSMCIEAMLGVPQAWSNYQSKSVEGLSIGMIMAWFIGDFGKTVYFVSMVFNMRLRTRLFSSLYAVRYN